MGMASPSDVALVASLLLLLLMMPLPLPVVLLILLCAAVPGCEPGSTRLVIILD